MSLQLSTVNLLLYYMVKSRYTCLGDSKNFIMANPMQTPLAVMLVLPFYTFEKTRVNLSVNNHSLHLNPWFITGFVDAEGSFILKIRKSPKYKRVERLNLSSQLAFIKKICVYWSKFKFIEVVQLEE